jgi:hypothetical protein
MLLPLVIQSTDTLFVLLSGWPLMEMCWQFKIKLGYLYFVGPGSPLSSFTRVKSKTTPRAGFVQRFLCSLLHQ